MDLQLDGLVVTAPAVTENRAVVVDVGDWLTNALHWL